MIEPSRKAAFAAIATLFGTLAVWSFGKWTDPVIDFGYELFVPWRITEGDVLYLDIAYRNGPLSSYWNALLFSVFGVSVRTLIIANLVTLAASTALLFSLLERVTTRYAALLSTSLFLVVCAFSQYGNIGNYNFVTPYQHGQTHGIALGLGVLMLLDTALRIGRRGPWIGAGFVCGLLFLTKAEVFVPALAASGGAIVFAPHSKRLSALATWAAGAVLPPVLALLALSAALPFAEALFATAGNWPYLGDVFTSEGFYASSAGFDAPGANLLRIAVALLGTALVGAVAVLAERRASGLSSAAVAIGGAAGLVAALAVDLPWSEVGRVLPVAMGIAIAAFARRAVHERDARAQLAVLFAVYALAMLGKLGIHPQIQHYGFALGAPALALGSALALGACRSHAPSAVLTAALVATGASAWVASDRVYAEKNFELAATLLPGDAIRVADPEVSPRGAAIERALRQLQARMAPEQSLLVMPEGAGLNYWLRRPTAGRYGLFLPTELAAHGGSEAVLERIRATPPDFVALVHRGHAEFGTGPFLQDVAYGKAFHPWLRDEYHPVSTIGAEPFRGPHFGILLLERNSGTPGP